MVHGWVKISRFFYPPYCLLCQDKTSNEALCNACHAELPWQLHACSRCAQPLHTARDTVCGACLQKPPPFEQAIVPLHYAWPLDRLLTRFKFGHRLSHGRLLGHLLADFIQNKHALATLPDAIVPVPLHANRLRQRGFNQADELARTLAKQLKLTVLDTVCSRQNETATQSSLTAAARQKNMRGAFFAENNLSGHLAIVDDVMTTGSTVTEMAKALKRAGAQRISVWCVARA